ncbi:MAG: U32 family peptidase, partial [Oscillospiraceae bacterium]
MVNKPELLSPAGDMERLKYAFKYGADAVYLGAEDYGMRASPKNFSLEQLQQAVDFANAMGKKIYLTLNTVPTNADLADMPDFIKKVANIGVHAVIVADLGVLAMVKEIAPEMEIHFSTQVGIMNYASANAAYALGAKRVVLARETTLEDIITIRKKTPPELDVEAFVHGAMCMSFSGRCLLSQYLNGRDANRGECSQPCRWQYQLSEKSRPDKYFDINETEDGTYILNANDLCMAPYIDMLCDAGVTSLKIEGRAKSFYYVASVTSAYRKALEAFEAQGKDFLCPIPVMEELTKTSHRRYSTGFYFGRDNATQTTDSSSYIRQWDLLAVVERYENGMLYCSQRGKFNLGDELEILQPNGEVVKLTPSVLLDETGGNICSTAHAMMSFAMDCPFVIEPMSI